LEAVEAVCGERADSWGTLDLLARLVQRSLVTSEEHGGEIRYRMLETIRQYAREHLQASGEEPAVLDRHSRWYLALAERAEPELRGPDQARWLSRLDRDHDNLRAALDWLTARGEHEATLRLAHGLWRFWFTKSYYREGRGRLEEALRRSLEADAALRAKALVGAGYLALNQEDYAAASRLLEESLAIGERLGDRRAIALALNWLGVVAWRLGEFGRAAALYEQGIGLAEAAGAEDVRTTLLNNTALLSASRGDFTLARALLEEALAIHRRKADKWGIANVAGNLAVMVFREGDPAAARAMVTESLQIFRELGDVRERASDLQLLGILAAERGQAARAARILGAVEAARDSVGAPFARIERALYDYERHVTMIREALGPDAFASAWAEGRAMGLGEAVEYALHDEPAASSVLDLTG
ncbi:MAG: tetratricopeptide repeat protein, partial [Armatimonadota bacterium]|nr:tetratricopeptide repeat protein [Armatimonadota bacterium]